MPTYEYECKDCGYRFEKFQSMSDDPLKTCPKCKGTVKRLISAGGGLIFKGSGFYINDYGKSNSKANTQKKSEDKKETSSEEKSTKNNDK